MPTAGGGLQRRYCDIEQISRKKSEKMEKKRETDGEGEEAEAPPVDISWKHEFVVRKHPLYAPRVGTGEAAHKKYRIMSVALEDTVGRVAVGCRDGKVQILDFA